jgi:hypothetical protein
MWLFKLPRVMRHEPKRERIAPMISLVVVLPLLPVTPITGIENWRRHSRANSDSAASGSATTTCGTVAGNGFDTSAATAPFCTAAATKL